MAPHPISVIDESDLRGSLAPNLQGMRQVTSQQSLEWARNHKCGFMETSAEDLIWNASPYMISSEDYLTNNKYL
ncbi:hypothetical protein SLS58_006408 [Diplodia intermedia]|uniref:Uncharacterized protein n=1 Tax=Diplodia intermedia TaxID=856260 RepID=A0ABR3TMX7_9PEZI